MKKEFLVRMVLVFLIGMTVYFWGYKPLMNSKSSESFKTDNHENNVIENKGPYDVVVVGEELDGIAAAVSASRAGSKVLLVSRSKDLGGEVSGCLDTDLFYIFSTSGDLLSKGFFQDISNRLGSNFSIGKYCSTIDNMVKEEKNLDVFYGADDVTPLVNQNSVSGIKIKTGKSEKVINAKRVIDSTWDGSLLMSCKVPFFNGSEDLNMKNTFVPARLNFELTGVDPKDVKSVISAYGLRFYSVLEEYKPLHAGIRINNFGIAEDGNEALIIKGIELPGVNLSDPVEVKRAYDEALTEATNFSSFLSRKLQVFNHSKFSKAADRLIIPEFRHFNGEYLLTAEDIFENKDFEDKIGVTSGPVEGGKFTNSIYKYVITSPDEYGIPAGCIVPKKVENLFMTGGKISYTSLASSSASKTATNIETGQAAGILAAYSVRSGLTPREVVNKKAWITDTELQAIFKKQGVYLPKIDMKNKNSNIWCYDSMKYLINLGLIAGGSKNEYGLQKEATEEDLGYILLNGVPRVSFKKYNLKFDASIRPFIKDTPLTKEAAGKMLLAMRGEDSTEGNFYAAACKMGYIDSLVQEKLKNTSKLTMDIVYYLGERNIKMYTGK
ncbi:MAG TPA: FAD-dependent oxidoreductase [Clostridia bacterium]